MKSRIAGAIVMRGNVKWLDKDLALELWDRNTQRNNNAKVTPAAPAAVSVQTAPTAEQLERFIKGLPEDSIPDLNESRARREHYQAEKARLEALQGRAELVTAAEVERKAFELARAVRDELAGIPDRVASMVASCSDVRQVHRMLSEEIRVALRGLADG